MDTCAGKLDKYIELQADSDTQNSYGEDVETWSTLANVWAERMSTSAAEKWKGDGFVGKITTTWRIRYRSDLSNLSRVVFEGDNYGVLGVTPIGRNVELLLLTEAIIGRV